MATTLALRTSSVPTIMSPPESPVDYDHDMGTLYFSDDGSTSDDDFASAYSITSDEIPDDDAPTVDTFLKARNTANALAYARNCDGDIHQEVWCFLETEIDRLWQVLQHQPDYIMRADEFALFNFFVHRFKDSAVTEGAITRFWQSYRI